MECIFCKIVKGEIPSKTIYEDSYVHVFQDIDPKAPIHWLIVPNKHIASIAELNEDDSEIIGKLLLQISKLAKEHSIGDYRIVANTGRNAGQSVFHLHFHILAGRTFSWPPG
ncbi:MAG: histidine triad nucleotide-binding protein [bacterium]|nr:histidine triad nucleotide-binding protein [bacterium]